MFFKKVTGVFPFSKARATQVSDDTFAFGAQDVAAIVAEWVQEKHHVRVRPDQVRFLIQDPAETTAPVLSGVVCTSTPARLR